MLSFQSKGFTAVAKVSDAVIVLIVFYVYFSPVDAPSRPQGGEDRRDYRRGAPDSDKKADSGAGTTAPGDIQFVSFSTIDLLFSLPALYST